MRARAQDDLIVLNKPYGVLCQFTDGAGRSTLADFVDVPDVYPAGRLDRDSEGLLVLTGNGALQHRIAHPRAKLEKVYWAQVEREPDADAIARLERGVAIAGRLTRPARARLLDSEPGGLWPRDPPIRLRLNVPTAWVELGLVEGRNRQVRRMTAAVGHPCLRLIRVQVGPFRLDGLAPGQWRSASATALDPALRGVPGRSTCP